MVKVTDEITSPIVLFAYAEIVTYLIRIFIQVVSVPQHSLLLLFEIFTQLPKAALVSWVLVQVHDEASFHWLK